VDVLSIQRPATGRRPDFPEKRLYTESDLQAGEWKSYSIGSRDEAAATKRRREANAAMHDELPSHALTYLSTPQRSMRQF
jgi:hypothetical protein